MALASVVRRYNFSRAELDGSRWVTLNESDPAKKDRLSIVLGLLAPEAVIAATSFPSTKEEYRPLVNVFRWTFGLESCADFKWPTFLSDEALNVQLIFDVYDQSISIYEAYGILESLSPTRPIPESRGRRLARSALKLFGAVSKASKIPVVETIAPEIFTFAADSIPSADTKDETLWYLHRFYLDPARDPRGDWDGKDPIGAPSYGIEWRITNRLLRTVGSRIAGVTGVFFFRRPERVGAPDAVIPPIKVRARCGLKPKAKKSDWMYFTWRPDCDPKRKYLDLNKLNDAADLNSELVVLDLRVKTSEQKEVKPLILPHWC